LDAAERPDTVVPSMLKMVVGDTHTIQALSAGGQTVTGLTWKSSDPPLLTARDT
jgi:hypothetical protein